MPIFSDKDKNIDINEYEVHEETSSDDINLGLEEDPNEIPVEKQGAYSDRRMDAGVREKVHHQQQDGKKVKKKKNEFGWAFFLASLFTGIGFTTVFGNPLPLFMGLAIGFLFFVDPIYERVMDAFRNN